MMLPANNELVQALNASDETAFNALYDHYSDALFRNIFKLLPHQQEAEDLLQSVFLQLWENRSRLYNSQSVAGWLFTTSFYLTMSRVRLLARQRLQSLEESSSDPADSNDNASDEVYLHKVRLLSNAIHRLPARKKLAFELCKMQGKSYSEAASTLNVSEDTVKEYVKSAMSTLKRYALQKDLSMYMLLLWIMQ
ncbi:RNA polymerase sigma factor [Pseudoflavitalea rhizosphaerae]|uniref:RNA polymerase sigma factor n=1 Tax=Pseudoflavitalea rhizosphaerae TaxID=1884793 RepID=UPI000F8F4BBF|nr:sigma-70 family RNA polymerase sigma factor [Pseudoflavitalea rhizosphaerae]